MEQVNARITLNLERLDRLLPPWHARALHSFVAVFSNVPEDCTSIVCRVFKVDGVSHYDIPCDECPAGARAYVIGTCFPDAGTAKYELHAYDAEGYMTALGEGQIFIDPFSATGAPIEPGQSVPIMQITDATGALHTISAVPDGMGGYTSIIDDGEE